MQSPRPGRAYLHWANLRLRYLVIIPVPNTYRKAFWLNCWCLTQRVGCSLHIIFGQVKSDFDQSFS